MSTTVRVPNKAGWALDEIIADHDPEIAELLTQLVQLIECEKEAAKSRYDQKAQLRIGDQLLVVTKLQASLLRVMHLHRLARNNEYDKR